MRPVACVCAMWCAVWVTSSGNVIGHLNHLVGHGKIVTGAAHDQHRGNAFFIIQLSDLIDERRDGFLVLGNQFLHAMITDHEIGGRGVLIQ